MNQANTASVPNMQVLNDVVLFDFIIGGSTGEKTVDGDDFMREVAKTLPPGTFSWVSALRNKAKREILKVGVARRVNNRVRGYFVPLPVASQLSAALTEIRGEFMAKKAEFLGNLEAITNEWAKSQENDKKARNGQLRSDIILKHSPTAGDLDGLLSFHVSAISVQSTGFFGADDALCTEVKGMVGQAALEIAEDVKKSWKGAKDGKTTSRVLGLIRRIRHKAKCMAIISPSFDRLAALCDTVLANVPEGQNIEGVQFLVVAGLLSRCSNHQTILSEETLSFDPLDVEKAAPGQNAASATPPAVPASAELDLTIAEQGGTALSSAAPTVTVAQPAPAQSDLLAAQDLAPLPGFDADPVAAPAATEAAPKQDAFEHTEAAPKQDSFELCL